MLWQTPFSLILLLIYLLQGTYFLQLFQLRKQLHYLFYGFFINLMCIYIIIINIGFILNDFELFSNILLSIGLIISSISFICYYFFLQHYFDTKNKHKAIHKLLNICSFLTVITLFVKFCFPNIIALSNQNYFKNIALTALPFYGLVFYFITTIKMENKLWLLFGIVILLLGIIISLIIAFTNKYINMQIQSIAHIPAQIGMLVEVCCTSYVLVQQQKIKRPK